MFIELGDDNMVRVIHHGLVDATQGYKIDALYTPTFHLSHFSINQLDSAGSTATFGGGICSILSPQSPITITDHRVNDLYIISHNVASGHTAPTLHRLPSAPPITVPCTPSGLISNFRMFVVTTIIKFKSRAKVSVTWAALISRKRSSHDKKVKAARVTCSHEVGLITEMSSHSN
jgi:hypothetical protein